MTCTLGERKCFGSDLYECMYDPYNWPDTKWLLIERDAPVCAPPPPPPECSEGATRCVGYDLYECIGGKWVLIDSNSPQCGYTPPPPPPEACEITITAPDSAAEGALVGADVTVKNVSPYHYSYKATIYAVPDLYPDYVIGSIDQVIMSGVSVLRNVSFTMPDCNTTVFVRVERWSKDHWVYDGVAGKVVSLEVPATFHLDVHVPSWAAGGYIEPGSGDYPAYSTVTLTAYPLSGYQFTGWGGDASGTSPTYNLYMNGDKYVEVYFEKVPVPEYRGTISKKELEYDETKRIIPVY